MKLREYLWKNQMTLNTFADKTSYNRTYLSHIVRGKMKPGRRCAEALERATDGYITAEELLNGIF